MKKASFKVGQRVLYVRGNMVSGYDGARGFYVEISKVGRRWVYLATRGERFDALDRYVDGQGFDPPGRIYLNEEEWAEEAERARLARAVSRLNVSEWRTVPRHLLHTIVNITGAKLDPPKKLMVSKK